MVDKGITKWFGKNLAELLAGKIQTIYKEFASKTYINTIQQKCKDLGYTKRIELHADTLKEHLPEDYSKAIKLLVKILGEENPKETGMFTYYYWIMPIGKFVEKYGIEKKHFAISIKAIEEITKRNTGEYSIRPFIRKFPNQTIKVMQKWSKSKNFHLRRLASEGCRPKLPWATKLETFIENPQPVFIILENLSKDDIKFVKRSVANNLTDYLKVNKQATIPLIDKLKKSTNKNTQWIVQHATRKMKGSL